MDKCEIAIDMLLWALKWDLGDVDTGVAAMQGSWGGSDMVHAHVVELTFHSISMQEVAD